MITINLTKQQHAALLDLMDRGFAYMDEHQYRDWKKMEKINEIIMKSI